MDNPGPPLPESASSQTVILEFASLASTVEAHERLLEAVLTASELLLCIISRDGRYLYVSEAIARAVGVPRTEMVGQSAAGMGMPEGGAARLAEERERALTSGTPVSGELRATDAAGRERVYVYTYSPLSLMRDSPEAVLCIARDVTEQRRAEAEAAEADLQLRAASQRDHDIAATLQRSLLQMPLPDAFPGLDIASCCEPAATDMEIGGDFVDAFRLDQSRVALVVGDVTGKGLPAAARIAEAKFTLRGFLREYPSCPISLRRLNSYLCDAPLWEGQSREDFVCVALAIYDAASGGLTVSTAGAETPLLARANGSIELLHAPGMPLGVMSDAEYPVVSTPLEVGDTLLMVTDGITEARRENALLGTNGLSRIVSRDAGLPLSDLAERVLTEARAFAGGTLTDDASFLLARRVA